MVTALISQHILSTTILQLQNYSIDCNNTWPLGRIYFMHCVLCSCYVDYTIPFMIFKGAGGFMKPCKSQPTKPHAEYWQCYAYWKYPFRRPCIRLKKLPVIACKKRRKRLPGSKTTLLAVNNPESKH